jgi:hypothetical protein
MDRPTNAGKRKFVQMPKKTKVAPEFFDRKRSSQFDCMKDTSTAFEWDLATDFPRAKVVTNVIGRMKEWADLNGLGLKRKISADKKTITAMTYEPTHEELAAMAVRVERRRVKATAKKLQQSPEA